VKLRFTSLAEARSLPHNNQALDRWPFAFRNRLGRLTPCDFMFEYQIGVLTPLPLGRANFSHQQGKRLGGELSYWRVYGGKWGPECHGSGGVVEANHR
jgi:hypothetical protein